MNEWTKRLKKTRIDNKSKKLIVELEKDLVKQVDSQKNEFVTNLEKKYEKEKRLSFNDIAEEVSSNYDRNSRVIKDSLEEHLQQVIMRAKEHAHKLLGIPKAKTASLKKIAGNFEDSIDKAFSSVDGIPDEIISKLRSEWISSGGRSDLTRQLLKQTIEDAAEKGIDPNELREALKKLYDRQRSSYQSIVRTTTINAYATAQLEEWNDEGIEEVERHCIDDDRTCPTCRALCTPGRNIYKVKALLNLQNPITHFSHPQCRDFITPIVNWSNLDEFLTEPIANIQIDKATIDNAPLSYQEELKELDRRIDVEGTYEFTADIVDTPEWLKETKDKYLQGGFSGTSADQMVEIEREDSRGHILSFDAKDKVILSGNAIDANSLAYSLSISKANDAWVKADKDYWTAHYDDLMSGAKPLVTLAAEMSPHNLFIEEWIMFHANPFRLLTLDDDGYSELADMLNKDYLEQGGVR